MLQITKPIELVNKNITCARSKGLFDRISENYQMINGNISTQDLLHVFTEPPQVFLAEGETTNIINNNIDIQNIQEKKLSVLNNLINRILISDQSDFTYQDRVYISTVLNKLGIKDEHTFMTQINALIDETKLTYAQNMVLKQSQSTINSLTKNIENSRLASGEENSDRAKAQEAEENFYLHYEILSRLNIAELTNYVNQITKRPIESNYIENREIIGAESLRIADHMVLQNFHNQLLNTTTPMVFNHENYYEDNIDLTENINEEKVSENLTKALLLSYIDNLYRIRVDKYFEGDNSWYDFTRSMYGSVENTVKRYTQNLIKPVSNSIKYEFHEGEIKNFSSMQEVLNTVLNESSLVFLDNSISNTTVEEQNFDTTSQTFNTTNKAADIVRNATETNNTLTHIENNNEVINNVVNEEEQILLALQQIEQRNIENHNQYIRALQELNERSNAEPRRRSSRERQRADSLRALENPEELLVYYNTEINEKNIEVQRTREEILSTLPADMRQYFEIINRFIVNPSPEDKKLMGTDPLSTLNHDIMEVQMQHAQTPQAAAEAIELNEQRATELIENVTNTHTIKRNISEQISEEVKKVEFVHKENATYIDEEDLAERFEELKREQRENQTVVNEVNTTTTQINKTEITKDVINQIVESDKLYKVVSDNVSDQIGSLTDMVYQKLERRLTNEKRRRGL